MQGKVKKLGENNRGIYGFIAAEDGNDYYFDSRSLVYGLDISEIKKDEIFDFEIFLNKKTNRTNAKNMHRHIPVQTVVADSDVVLKEKKKSKIKAAGLKSVFKIGDTAVMTSFGKGNAAIKEKEADRTLVTSLQTPEAFSARIDGRKFVIAKNDIQAETDNPLFNESDSDIIHLRDALEKEYFDKTFTDNIHIQLIYNILDIKKILTVYINNIVYAVNNIARPDSREYDDFMGYLSNRNTYERFSTVGKDQSVEPDIKIARNIADSYTKFTEFLNNERLGYFGSAFIDTGHDTKAKMNKQSQRSEEDIFYLLSMLGTLRQSLIHSMNSTKNFMNEISCPVSTDINYAVNQCIIALLDKLYNERVNSLNSDFLKKSAKDIALIFQIFDVTDIQQKRAYVQDYYNFIVTKSYKNMGFSIKKLRERLLENINLSIIKSTAYDSVRSKLYKQMDFVIYRYYCNNPVRINDNVNALRSTLDAQSKENFYKEEAEYLYGEIGNTLLILRDRMNGKYISKLQPDKTVSDDMLKSVCISTEADNFSKMMYAVTLFLDGKEINGLITTLINKFDNIAVFIQTLKDNGLNCEFKHGYDMFAKAEQIAKELRIINSFARMQQPAASAKKAMYEEAVEILGIDESSRKRFRQYMDSIYNSDDEANGLKPNKGLRNFIANNVVESSRFKYLVRYNNAKKVRKLATNKSVIRFVLGNIPAAQIEKYYKSCNCGRSTDTVQQIDALTRIITNLNFKDFENVVQSAKTRDEKMFKSQMQAVIGLYLTVVYLLTKNLVNINARYVIAFHCYERDEQLHKIRSVKGPKNWRMLTNKFITISSDIEQANKDSGFVKNDRPWLKKRVREYLTVNMANTTDSVISNYRNNVAHLSAIRNSDLYIDDISGNINSYFELYHYLMQRQIKDSCEESNVNIGDKTKAYFASVIKHGTYCKDFVKALNTPFGYNLARYKNLSIAELFEM